MANVSCVKAPLGCILTKPSPKSSYYHPRQLPYWSPRSSHFLALSARSWIATCGSSHNENEMKILLAAASAPWKSILGLSNALEMHRARPQLHRMRQIDGSRPGSIPVRFTYPRYVETTYIY